jgi:5-oxopent-3-ene-1,2,5-tricarboxylate decarboxylase/2-hydroxyhepta-2,4-diene-1,7-dioate isomerase
MRLARIRPAGRAEPIAVRLDAGPGRDALTGFEPIPADGWLPPARGMVYGVILNDQRSLEAYGERMTKPPHGKPPAAPVLYFKPYNTHAGHQAVVELPDGVERVEVGATLGIVFDATCTRATHHTALEAVAGYTLAIDLSIPKDNLYRPPIVEKCWDRSLVMGPWVAERNDVLHPGRLTLTTSINGRPAYARSTADLVRPILDLIADITAFMSFHAGDVLLVGYPLDVPTAGAGDAIALECEEIGRLECRLTAAEQSA